MNLRLQKETSQRIELATTQYVMAEQDQISGNLVMARQRLEYVLKIYPAYPGLADKLAQVMLQISLNKPQTAAQTTPEPAVTSVPTKDTTVLSELFTQAQNQLTAADWPGLLGTVNKMRNIDPSYKPIQVDGMYYYALRYNGIAQIKAGAFEVGMYYLAMAEQIAPLDENDKSEVTSWQNWAKMYQIAGSWYGVNWQKSSDLFSALSQQVPYMVDINGVTTKQRYVNSMIGIGDNLMAVFDYCNAENQYKIANGILSNDKLIAKIQTADQDCANPPATPTPTEDPNAPKPTKIPTPSGE
jgi:hypothetical protein